MKIIQRTKQKMCRHDWEFVEHIDLSELYFQSSGIIAMPTVIKNGSTIFLINKYKFSCFRCKKEHYGYN